MLNIYLTVDTEIWPENWDLSEKKFPRFFDQYIRGTTSKGEYGLPFQLHILKEHNLKAVFFIEPLFAHHYGLSPLRDIVSMIQEAGQSVELHLHTEWVSRTKRRIPPGRFQLNIRDYTKEEQTMIIREGIDNLLRCDTHSLSAFRAGNFGANRDTFDALENNDIAFDSSYNLTSALGPCLDTTIYQPIKVGNIIEYPVTVFKDGFGHNRHLQVGAASYREMVSAMEQAHQNKWNNLVLFWHSTELLNRKKTRHDPIAINRFTRLCEFLAQRKDVFSTCHFEKELLPDTNPQETRKLHATKLDTAVRHGEQLIRRLWGS